MSTLKVNTIQNTSGVEVYTAKAWVNFNGTGTVAIRAAGNVSSITDNGTGDYTVNFTNAMTDANYSASGLCSTPGTAAGIMWYSATPPATGSFRIATSNTTFSYYDHSNIYVAIFR